MNRRLLIAQIVNVLGLANFLVILMLQNKLAATITRFSLLYSSILIIGSFTMIFIFSISFLRKIKNDQKCSSSLSPIFRYFLSNFATSAILALFVLGCFIDVQILKVCLLVFIVFIFPIVVYNKSVYVVLNGKEVRFYSYSNNFESIMSNQIKAIKKVSLGMIYKIKYNDTEGVVKAKYFFPKGKFIFFEPSSVKRLKSMM